MKASRVFEVDAVTVLVAQFNSLSKEIDGMMVIRATTIMLCETCSGRHPINDFPIVRTSLGQHEQLDFVSGVNQPQGNLYSSTHNLG